VPTATRRRHARTRLAAFVPIVVALLVAACSGGGAGGITTSGAWARTSPMVAGAGAANVTIQNGGSAADALVGARSTVAKSTEVHETYALESAMPGQSTGMGGSPMMGMRRIDRVEIPAGGTLELKPGGYHIMLIELTQPLEVGQQIEITLVFEKAGEVRVTAEVREG
jgi:hypothetical protein